MGAACSGAKVVNALQFGMLAGDGEKVLTFFFRPFAVHQLIYRMIGCTPCVPRAPEGDTKTIERVRPSHAADLFQNKRCDRTEEHTTELQSLLRIPYAVLHL